MSDLLAEQFARLLDAMPSNDPWPLLEQSGFLDLLASDEAPPMEELFPLTLEVGRRAGSPPVLEAMAARLVNAPPGLSLALAAGEMAGALTAVQAMTVEYARTRTQFGREIGRFQAVQHQVAVLAEETMAARISVQAAFVGAPRTMPERKAAAAKIRCNQAAGQVSAIAHAVHGAIGISQEYSLHAYTRRLRALAMAHGGQTHWAVRLGDWALQEGGDMSALVRAL